MGRIWAEDDVCQRAGANEMGAYMEERGWESYMSLRKCLTPALC